MSGLIAVLYYGAKSPSRRRTFRRAVAVHLGVLLICVGAAYRGVSLPGIGHVLLVEGIVQGAVLAGWRLTQIPKSQALEFLFVSPLGPATLFLGETVIGLGMLGMVVLSGVPIFALLVGEGMLRAADAAAILIMSLSWGACTASGLVVWAYESGRVRQWGERIMLGLLGLYLGVGMLAGEHLRQWILSLPSGWDLYVLNSVEGMHRYNPFAVLEYVLAQGMDQGWPRLIGLEAAVVFAVVALVARGATRLRKHFDEYHYQPQQSIAGGSRPIIGDKPLSWWAVRRVTRYAGRVNLWLATAFGSLYALYTVGQNAWPSWCGKAVFQTFDQIAGVAGVATALAILAAVPAAFQYGLWDSNPQERCRRLEILLLTGLTGPDYWDAAAAAAWKRGRGYLGVACLLWMSAAWVGSMTVSQLIAAVTAAVVLWCMSCAIGFWAFARGRYAAGLGMIITVGLPASSYVCNRLGWTSLASVLPAGTVYHAAAGQLALHTLAGILLCGILSVILIRQVLDRCVGDLRNWYDRHHGCKALC